MRRVVGFRADWLNRMYSGWQKSKHGDRNRQCIFTKAYDMLFSCGFRVIEVDLSATGVWEGNSIVLSK